MRRALLIPALLAPLFNPMTAAALQTEVDVQGITRTDERLEWADRVAEVRTVLRERRYARAAAREAAQAITDGVEVVTDGMAGLIYDIFGAYGAKAVSVASCESGLNPSAVNPSGASGLFQLMPIHWEGRFDPFDPVANTRYAFQLSSGGTDWSAWMCA